jgi:hypothetical protein
MDHICLRDEDLPGMAALPVDSPARRPWESCVRCRARVAAFAEFLQPSVAGAGREWEEADARLAAALESEIGGGPVPERAPAGERTAPDAGRPLPGYGASRSGPADGSARRLFRWLWQPSLRPVAAVAVVVVVLVTIQGIRRIDRPESDAIVLRDGTAQTAAALEPREVKRLSDGALSLSWSPADRADRYEVALYGEDLVERKRLDAANNLSLTVPAGEWSALAGSSSAGLTGPAATTGATGATDSIGASSRARGAAPLFWRVIAYRGGDVIAQSKIRSVAAPAR